MRFLYSDIMQANHHDAIHDFFHTFSQVAIILPVIFVVFAILLKTSKSDSTVIKKNTAPAIIQASPSPLPQSRNTLDLIGPSVCSLQTKEASWSAFIQNKMIRITSTDKTKTTNFLIKEDCYYTWEKNKYSGEKMCGIGQILSIAENLFNSGLINESIFNSLLDQVKGDSSLPFQYKDIQKIISSCKKSNASLLNQFDLPKQVLFKSK